jgi:hypothetical protein
VESRSRRTRSGNPMEHHSDAHENAPELRLDVQHPSWAVAGHGRNAQCCAAKVRVSLQRERQRSSKDRKGRSRGYDCGCQAIGLIWTMRRSVLRLLTISLRKHGLSEVKHARWTGDDVAPESTPAAKNITLHHGLAAHHVICGTRRRPRANTVQMKTRHHMEVAQKSR